MIVVVVAVVAVVVVVVVDVVSLGKYRELVLLLCQSHSQTSEEPCAQLHCCLEHVEKALGK